MGLLLIQIWMLFFYSLNCLFVMALIQVVTREPSLKDIPCQLPFKQGVQILIRCCNAISLIGVRGVSPHYDSFLLYI